MPAPGRSDRPLQAKLAVGPVNDRYEREADRVADSVARAAPLPASSPLPVITGLGAQRAPAAPKAGPEQTDENNVAPEKRAQRTVHGKGTAPKPAPRTDDAGKRKTAPKIAQKKNAGPATGAEGGVAPSATESAIQRMRARPAPGLDPSTRAQIEPRLGADLGSVRLHTDSGAASAAEALGARAFTVGNDIFFARNQYDPVSTEGRRLIAHEAVHTVQQAGGSARARRTPDPVTPPAGAAPAEVTRIEHGGNTGWAVDLAPAGAGRPELTLPELRLPQVGGALKGAAGGQAVPVADTGRSLPVEGAEFVLAPVGERPEGRAYETWLAYMRATYLNDVQNALTARLQAQTNAAPIRTPEGEQVYVLRRTGATAANSENLLVGTVQELARSDGVLRPMLGPRGGSTAVDADHILELQLGGKDAGENMWLLESSFNRSVGSSINNNINTSIRESLRAARSAAASQRQGTFVNRLPSDPVQVRRGWTIRFRTVRAGSFGSTSTIWTPDQIRTGTHLRFFTALNERELVQQGFRFRDGVTPRHINVFPGPEGGRVVRFQVSRDGHSLDVPDYFYRGVEIKSVTSFTPPTTEAQGGVLAVLRAQKTRRRRGTDLFERSAEDRELTVRHDPRLGFGGYITRQSVSDAFRDATFVPLSPVTFSDIRFSDDGELVGVGSILSSKALLPQLSVPIILRGDEVLIQFPIPTDRLNFGPVHVTEAALEMGVGEGGFFIQGVAGIAVDQIGRGRLSARAEDGNVIFSGIFDLDLDFLDPAQVSVTYSLRDDALTAQATLGVGAGRLPGVDSGRVTVTMSRDGVGVDGTLTLGGILAGGTVRVGYTRENGLILVGENIPLPVSRLPGVTNATVTVRAIRNPDDGTWSVTGAGSASLAAAGATGQLDIAYDGQAVLVHGRADVSRGPASGWLQITATNREIDDEGNPVEGGPVGDLHIFGRGAATIAFGDFLTGTAGLEYTPDGRVIINGRIEVQPRDLFDQRRYDRTLLALEPPEFPIWGVSLGGVGFGIFAFVNAYVRFESSVGPGQLRNTYIDATIDLDHPELATVEGNAEFFVPAYAGFTLDLGGGLSARAAVAYARGRVGLDGSLGIEADASAAVNVSWSPTSGLAMETTLEANARPKFRLGVNASITAGVDLYFTEIDHTWGPWRRTLGEFGPDMELNATFPVRWSERDGLDINFDDIEQPDLDAVALMSNAFDTLV